MQVGSCIGPSARNTCRWVRTASDSPELRSSAGTVGPRAHMEAPFLVRLSRKGTADVRSSGRMLMYKAVHLALDAP